MSRKRKPPVLIPRIESKPKEHALWLLGNALDHVCNGRLNQAENAIEEAQYIITNKLEANE